MTELQANQRAVCITIVSRARRETHALLNWLAETGQGDTPEFKSAFRALERQTDALRRHRAANPQAN